ncbi:MAG: glucose-6-phosphate isomerase [Bdellovibrionales bacterium]
MIRLTHSTHQSDSQVLEECRRAFKTLLVRKDIGFHRLPEAKALWEAAQSRAEQIQKQYTHMAVLGIGGSSLGGLALTEALRKRNVIFFENVDAKDFWLRLEELPNIEKVHWVIVSKSGKTVETLTQTNFLYQFLKTKNIELKKCSTVVSETKSNPLSDWARTQKIPLLEIPEDVGGRFSVLSSVGLLPAAFTNINLESLKKGARWSVEQEELVAQLCAQSLQSFKNQKWTTVFWAYCNQLRSFGLWIEQLWAESLAKKQNRLQQAAPRVSTPISLIGANDQHSVLQQIAEGFPDKFVWFLRVTESERYGPRLQTSLFKDQDEVLGKTMGDLLAAEAQATRAALESSGVSSLTLEVAELSDASIGALFMLFELVTATLGEVMNINAFDQPGVELGKGLAREILSKN